ncbi:FBP domain-containing protein [Streptomyces anulatus]
MSQNDERERLNAVGLLLCTDLDCAVKVHGKPVREAFDRPVDEIITSRREGLRSRTTAFVRSVAEPRQAPFGVRPASARPQGPPREPP